MQNARKPAAAWWISNAHLQTAWARMARSRRLVKFDREIMATPDGDELVLDHGAGPPGSPRVLLLHGLEGSAYSLHTQGLALLVAEAGWRSTVLNFRSCARDPADIRVRLRNRRPRLYHSGETGDLDLVVRALAAREPAAPLFAIGFSLGGNVLLKWLGQAGRGSAIRAGASICAPYEPGAASRFLERRVGRIYTAHFMRRLRSKALDVVARFPGETSHLHAGLIHGARTFREFDQHVTAPLHGFASADDYYRDASSLGDLPRIAVPTLCISSTDDPFYPAAALAAARAASAPSADVAFEVTGWGGHVGFVSGRWPWRPHYWAEERAVAWLAESAGLAAPRFRSHGHGGAGRGAGVAPAPAPAPASAVTTR